MVGRFTSFYRAQHQSGTALDPEPRTTWGKLDLPSASHPESSEHDYLAELLVRDDMAQEGSDAERSCSGR